MTRDDFVAALEEQLRIRGYSFSRADLLDFVQSVWLLAEDDPDPVRWAGRFVEAGRAGARGWGQVSRRRPPRVARDRFSPAAAGGRVRGPMRTPLEIMKGA